ncbi:hypothetical protein [Microtetraspora sp. NBRC 13810]|nr:hypothetical protein [Microtetraspora sp. NBRC 13810]
MRSGRRGRTFQSRYRYRGIGRYEITEASAPDVLRWIRGRIG